MLSRDRYEQSFVDECRRLVDEQIRAYNELTAATHDDGAVDTAIAEFEPRWCAGMVLALDAMFMHRQRARFV